VKSWLIKVSFRNNPETSFYTRADRKEDAERNGRSYCQALGKSKITNLEATEDD
jgi:hypothetical protein